MIPMISIISPTTIAIPISRRWLERDAWPMVMGVRTRVRTNDQRA